MARLSSDVSSELAQFLIEQPRFSVSQRGNSYMLDGYYLVNHKFNGFVVYQGYPVVILIPYSYPDALPIVYSNPCLIPSQFDHINKNGSLCLSTPKLQFDFLSVNSCLVDFFDVILVNYFFSVEYFRKYKVYPFGQWSHGHLGELEYLNTQGSFIRNVRKNASNKK